MALVFQTQMFQMFDVASTKSFDPQITHDDFRSIQSSHLGSAWLMHSWETSFIETNGVQVLDVCIAIGGLGALTL
jgi:hypothetical protein